MTTVTYLGPAGTFTEQAMLDMAATGGIPGGVAELTAIAVDSPVAALAAVRTGEADYACVAIESSVDGPVTSTFDALTEGPELQIYRETEVGVSFSILIGTGIKQESVRTLAAHSVAYPQVKDWVTRHLPGVDVIFAPSNAAAAHMVADGTTDACVATARAGELLGLTSLADGVADVRGAQTRFILVGAPGPLPEPTGKDRTGVSFTLPNQPGTLLGAMNEFAVRGVNLSRVESRPTRETMGSYRFHLDIIGHLAETPVWGAVAALHRNSENLRFLGSWPACRLSAADTPPPDISESVAWVNGLYEGRR
ncbi:prephenate dehydratase [Corynebacterium sp. TAE3-ERU12]|uniref:prephenate dehydratase n=1 Tax=Corynebacterium sp. TAE3-ERU12 TaxID=2849491 RepID=UPI001C43E7BC|nr:prephenate dehydratase [Corynebacterium sp. TAE3-ERU12]MBV7296083.1 prephenate dehydratase [Corynebacterium sp. TAE3-ERU12]